LGLLTRSPLSAYYGQTFEDDPDLAILEFFRNQECSRLVQSAGGAQ
jgi:hypothetical protein